jgi:ribonucleoside-diphosphate reductase alpha chain
MNAFANEISDHVWRTKYRYADRTGSEQGTVDTWRRIASALAAAEPKDAPIWEDRFFSILQNFKFLPGGRIQAGAGTTRNVTLFNRFVMGPIEDSIPGIFRALQEGAVTMQQGGGIGIDFSTLRPRGTHARGAGNIASGPVSFMQMWDSMCGTILSTGTRRGAMMATLRCDHPDIEEFVAAKRQAGYLRRFNMAVLVTDAFMAAVRSNYYEGWHPGTRPATRSRSAFLGRIHDGVHRDPGVDTEQVTRAVFALLAARLPAAEIENAKAATPSTLHNLWPS